MKINSITTLDLIGFIKLSFEQHKFIFKDFINDKRQRGERDVDYWFIVKDENKKIILEDCLKITNLVEDSNHTEEEMLTIGRTYFLSHALYMLIHRHSKIMQ